MKIRRKRVRGPNEPLRHPDHPRPVTRREFLGQGFVTGSIALAGASVFSLFADPRKAYATLSPDIALLKLPPSQGGLCDIKLGAGMIPFICFDLAGGANIAGSNVLVGQKGGQLDFLSTAGYSKLGIPGNMTPNSSIGAGSFVDRQLGLAFHSDSAFLRGILERTAAATRTKVNGTVIPALSQNDTANNPHNPMYGIYSTGARGDLLTLIGTDSSDSGGNSMAPSYMMDSTARPTKVDQASDVTGLVDTGKLVGLLSQADATLVLESMERISKKKLDSTTMLSVPTADQVAKDLVQCGYVRAADLADRYGNSKQALDPDIDPMIVGPTGDLHAGRVRRRRRDSQDRGRHEDGRQRLCGSRHHRAGRLRLPHRRSFHRRDARFPRRTLHGRLPGVRRAPPAAPDAVRVQRRFAVFKRHDRQHGGGARQGRMDGRQPVDGGGLLPGLQPQGSDHGDPAIRLATTPPTARWPAPAVRAPMP